MFDNNYNFIYVPQKNPSNGLFRCSKYYKSWIVGCVFKTCSVFFCIHSSNWIFIMNCSWCLKFTVKSCTRLAIQICIAVEARYKFEHMLRQIYVIFINLLFALRFHFHKQVKNKIYLCFNTLRRSKCLHLFHSSTTVVHAYMVELKQIPCITKLF